MSLNADGSAVEHGVDIIGTALKGRRSMTALFKSGENSAGHGSFAAAAVSTGNNESAHTNLPLIMNTGF